MLTTQATVNKLAVSAGNKIFWDTKVPGLGVRVSHTGKKVWLLKYRAEGRQRKLSLGDAGPNGIGLRDAREIASQQRSQVAQGGDPRGQIEARAVERTVEDVAAEWLDKHATGLKSERAIRGYVNNDILPAMGAMKITDVRKSHVAELIEKKATALHAAAAARGTTTSAKGARDLLGYARDILSYAATRDLIPANPAADLKPKELKVKGQRKATTTRARKRFLSAEEITELWTTDAFTTQTHLLLKLVLVTGQRPGEVCQMRESDIEGRWWTVPAEHRGKTNTENLVYLSDAAMELLEAARAEKARLRERRNAAGTDFVFETGAGQAMRGDALSRAVARAELGDWRPHDLRRTMRTGLAAAGVQTEIAEIVLGHTRDELLETYDQHDYRDERRRAAEAWEGRLRELLSGAGNVVTQEAS